MTSQSPGALFPPQEVSPGPVHGGGGGGSNGSQPASLPPGQQAWATGGPPTHQFETNLFGQPAAAHLFAHQGHQGHQAGQSQNGLNMLPPGGGHLAPLVGQQLNSLMPSNQQQGQTLNMMLQSMQAQGMLPHSHLQSPPNSMGQGLFYLPPGGRVDRPDIAPSPNGLQPHPQPAQTPPAQLMDDRSWSHNMFMNRIPTVENKSLEEQLKQQQQQQQQQHHQQQGGHMDMFHMDPGFASNFNGMAPDRVVQVAAAMNQFGQFMVPNNSGGSPPPGSFMAQMPPRPRPEGGQDPSPNFLQQEQQHDSKSSDLVIDSWTDEDNEKASLQPQFGGQCDDGSGLKDEGKMMGMGPGNMGGHGGGGNPMAGMFNSNTGWGAPPPGNPGGWGAAKPQPMSSNNWQQPPPQNQTMGNVQNMQFQPPMHHTNQPPPSMEMGAHQARGGMHGGMVFDGGRGRGGRGHFDYNQDRGRGRGMRGGSRGSSSSNFRGGRGGTGNFQEREMEKVEGRQGAIAETIAMMKKMKMEDEEKKKEADLRREQRKEMGLDVSTPNEYDDSPVDDRYPDRRPFYDRGRGRGGRGQHRGRGRGNAGMGMGMMGGMGGGMFQGPPPGSGMMLPPQAIPPFPGLEGFLPPQMAGFPPGAPGGFPPPFHPSMYMQPPGQFPGGRGFPRGRGGGMPPSLPPHFSAMMGVPQRGGGGHMRGGRGRGSGARGAPGGFRPRDEHSHAPREDGEGGEAVPTDAAAQEPNLNDEEKPTQSLPESHPQTESTEADSSDKKSEASLPQDKAPATNPANDATAPVLAQSENERPGSASKAAHEQTEDPTEDLASK